MPVHSPEDPDEALRSLLADLASSARVANLARVDVVAEGRHALAGNRLDETLRTAAARAAHQVVGSAGTFGSRVASDLAAELERYFESGADPAGLAAARDQLGELRDELEAGHQLDE
jgi:HPt (histidine-containing phosphotransfer) domain-containing protein